jgi:hypothetical protein
MCRFALNSSCAHLNDPPGARSQCGIVSHEHQRRAVGAVHFKEHFHYRPTGFRIEIPRGFIGEKDPGSPGKRAGEGNALLFTARKLERIMITAAAQTHPFKEATRLCPSPGNAAEFERDEHIFQGGECGQELETLENEPDPFIA